MRDLVEGLRFSYETELFDQVKSSLGEERVKKHEDVVRKQFHQRKRALLADSVRITAGLLPEVHNRYMDCLHLFGGELTGDLYVQQSPTYNASVLAHGDRFDVMVHSSLLNDFTLDELTFVIGHELGHVLYGHSSFNIHEYFQDEQGQVDADTASMLFAWSRAAEVSADRIGMVCAGTLGAATSALFKTSSGIPGVSQTRVLNSLREQYDDLVSHMDDEGEGYEWVRTHPMVPIRFKAIEMGALDLVSVRNNPAFFSPRGFRHIDKQIGDLLRHLDARSGPTGVQGPGSSKSLPMPAQKAAGLMAMIYVALVDGAIGSQERKTLTDAHMNLRARFPLSELMDKAVKHRDQFVEHAPEELKNRARMLHPDDVMVILRLCVAMCLQHKGPNRQERGALVQVATSLGSSEAELDTVINELRFMTPTIAEILR